MALQLQTPDFLAAARMHPASPFASAVSGALNSYVNLSKLAMEKKEAKKTSDLRDLQIKSETEKLKALPQQLKTAATTAVLNQKETQMRIKTASLSNAEATHLYLGHKLSDLMTVPKDQRPQAYQAMKQHLTSMGIDATSLPDNYNAQVENLGKVAQQNLPRSLEDRKFQESIVRDEYNNRAKIAAATARAGGAAATIPGATSIPGGTVSPAGTTPPGSVTPAPAVSAPPISTQPGPAAAAPSVGPAAAPAPAIAPTVVPAPGSIAPASVQPQDETLKTTAPAPQPSAQGVKITSSAGVEKSYEKQMGTSFGKAMDNATNAANAAFSAIGDIDTFTRMAAKMPLGTGPWAGITAPYSAAGNQAIKSQNRLVMAMTGMIKMSRLTNKILGMLQNANLNVHMFPSAWKALAPQLKMAALSTIEYQKFLHASSLVGIRNIGLAQSIWSKFQQENPPIDVDSGKILPENLTKWHHYLSPIALKGELERQVDVPQGFVFPGSPEAAKRGAK
jgi:hypothetical protein